MAEELEAAQLDLHAPYTASATAQRLDMLADVVHAQDRRTALVGRDRGARPRRASCPTVADGSPRILRERALAREADEHRPSDRDQLRQAPDELEVVLDRLAEPDPGVEADELLADPLRHGEREPLLEERLHLGDDVVVARVVLHRPRLAVHVHEAADSSPRPRRRRRARGRRAARSRRSPARRRARARAARPRPSPCRSTPAARRAPRAPERRARAPRRAGRRPSRAASTRRRRR